MLNEKLQKAIKIGRIAACRTLIQQGADVNVPVAGNWEWPGRQTLPLVLAAASGQTEICRLLIDSGAQLNAIDGDGNTALHMAASNGLVEIYKLLIDGGANVLARNRSGATPLHHACYMGRVDVCRLLVEAGASVHEVDDTECAPLHEAARRGHAEVCRYLIDAGANVHNVSAAEDTPLHCAAQYNHLAACRTLVELGADPSFVPQAPSSSYTTPFQTSLEFGRLEVARFFMAECGEDSNQRTLAGHSLDEIVKVSKRMEFLSLKTEIEIETSINDAVQHDARPAGRRFAGMSPL